MIITSKASHYPITAATVAPAKVNLALHVTGVRSNGYHDLDSLMVFLPEITDHLTITINNRDHNHCQNLLELNISGRFAKDLNPLPAQDNLIIKAAEAFGNHFGITFDAKFNLTKNLPISAGIGGGSSDGAATLWLLCNAFNIKPDREIFELGACIGTDVPICLYQKVFKSNALRLLPQRSNDSDIIAIKGIPTFAAILVNPAVAVQTARVFKLLTQKYNRPLPVIAKWRGVGEFTDWLKSCRNDLTIPAMSRHLEITMVLEQLKLQPNCLFAAMSGSGSTCFGIFASLKQAQQAAKTLALGHNNWWISVGCFTG